jgi:hypothetical protein
MNLVHVSLFSKTEGEDLRGVGQRNGSPRRQIDEHVLLVGNPDFRMLFVQFL